MEYYDGEGNLFINYEEPNIIFIDKNYRYDEISGFKFNVNFVEKLLSCIFLDDKIDQDDTPKKSGRRKDKGLVKKNDIEEDDEEQYPLPGIDLYNYLFNKTEKEPEFYFDEENAFIILSVSPYADLCIEFNLKNEEFFINDLLEKYNRESDCYYYHFGDAYFIN